MKSKNSNITLVKFIFMIGIIVLHYAVPYGTVKNIFMGGYIYVDFFFIIQGFFIEDVVKKYDPATAEKNYILSRLRRFFPVVFVQAVILMLLEVLFFCHSLKEYAVTMIGTLYQLSFVSVLLEKNLLNNGTLWFLSAYITVGTGFVMLVKKYGKAYRYLSLLVSAMLFNYIINQSQTGGLDAWHDMALMGAVSFAVLRAFAGISLGYCLRGLYEYLLTIMFFSKNFVKNILSVCGGVLVLCSILFAAVVPHTEYDYVQICIFALIMLTLNLGSRIKERKALRVIDKMILPMYVWQVVSIRIISLTGSPNFLQLGVVILLDFLISAGWILIENKMTGVFLKIGIFGSDARGLDRSKI